MKIISTLGLTVLAATVCSSAMAQSSVTLYGLIDAGITYTNHVSSSSGSGYLVQLTSGNSQGSRWGLRGSEDLGDGLKATFNLENGFDVTTGALGQGGLEFGRQATVGLTGGFGTVTLGRQYDFIAGMFPAYALAANTPAGLLAWSLPEYGAGGGTLDNRIWGDWTNNAVRYLSPTLGGFSFGALYGFGNVAGSLGSHSVVNVYAGYNQGSLSAALSYITIHNATASANTGETAAGASYRFGRTLLFGNVTDVRLSSGTRARATTFEAGLTYLVLPTLSLGGGFQYQTRNNDVGSANQWTLTADYFLSKRTDVYLVGALAHDHGFGARVQAALGAPSDTDAQSAIRVGIRTKF